ncbi:hypothetical protein GGS23DRAFT_574130 [Durotheca rogersii]|uniref:uncharacterized protein n=1 Tax=Durotheca rogersii TaxID=419775 RepID=UPI002220C9AD|nr:uncharacterized protein GGS23DRAFT_574130 [Durotheca rogersii]KAI5862008.1 hypothetical protein GGS23DRAFT_574130 [Durotheca rogersii]
MAGVLGRFDGQPTSTWPNTVLTLNGLIAILATLCRASFMLPVAAALSQAKWNRFTDPRDQKYHRLDDFQLFDDASRGPWGSVHLLWRFRLVHIGCLGALLTILSLAFGAFSQQLVDIRIEAVPTTSQGQIGDVARSRWVDAVVGISNSWTPVSATKLAIYDGFLARSIGIPQVTCPTGNCTWPVIPTVGVCGSCVDLTEDISYDRLTSSLCRLTLLDGPRLQAYCDSEDFMPVFTLGPGTGRVFDTSDPRIPSRDAPNTIGEFSALGLPGSKTPGNIMTESRAADCGLWYCLQARNVSVQLGELSDVIVDTWSKAITIESAPFTGNVTFTDIPPNFNTEPEAVYGMAAMQMFGMRQYLNKTVIGNVSADALLGVVASTTDYAEGIHANLDEMDDWIARLTRSMTNNVRENNVVPSDQDLHRGTIFGNETVFTIRWGWIAYPAVLVFLSTLYLIVEVVRTAYGGAAPWKSDALLPICIGIDEEAKQRAIVGVYEPDGTKEEIGKSRVRLLNLDSGLMSFEVQKKVDA